MVLEGSFLQMDNTYNKLQTLCEYIDDTEARLAALGLLLVCCCKTDPNLGAEEGSSTVSTNDLGDHWSALVKQHCIWALNRGY